MSAKESLPPRNFYLNEQHELAHAEREGGGRVPQYADIDWAVKGGTISRSLDMVDRKIKSSLDPLKDDHYFLIASPVETLAKVSRDKSKAVDGKIFETPNFGENYSRVFRRLGLDLISVAADGSAVVHMKPEKIRQLSNTAESLSDLGAREKSRWAAIDSFDVVPMEARIDTIWLRSLKPEVIGDAVIELQALLTRTEIDSVFRAVLSSLRRDRGEAATGTGTDFSGRQWLRAKLTPESLSKLAHEFFSIQALHSPLISIAAGTQTTRQLRRSIASLAPIAEAEIARLPTVAVVDTGVPNDHRILGKYRRGTYASPTFGPSPADSHGCFVSSRIVFGDQNYNDGPPNITPNGSVRYYDIRVGGIRPGEIDSKVVIEALQAVVRTAPDVRVFNLSFDSEPLNEEEPVKTAEALLLVQDLDNFIYQNDVLVVIAAGNSPPGVIPATDYPRNFDDPQWAIGAWARSFNSLTCGSYVGYLSPGGVVTELGWPSPFCRVGPGLSNSPKPDFSANGGNITPEYRYAPGLGVWGLSPDGFWEDRSGTSHAAPLLSRECAFAFGVLQTVCERGAQPFSVTVKAFLALTASPAVNHPAVAALAERTLGRGEASALRLSAPETDTGVMIWQGVLEDEGDVARIRVPIPSKWLRDADQPRLRLVVAWDPPVNAAVRILWGTRAVYPKLKRHAEAKALHPLRGRSNGSYPLTDRHYDLGKVPLEDVGDEDFWLIELEYAQTAEYHPAMVFPLQQRVAFAAELVDEGEKRLSPQPSLQSLPLAQTMTRLSSPPLMARMPVVLRTQI